MEGLNQREKSKAVAHPFICATYCKSNASEDGETNRVASEQYKMEGGKV